ncbi:MAG: sugar ABC transporter permease [Chloroflexi bacterium]|nr:sugar ABC transporter permease [Chloroflexota bacterium]MBV9546506.1 sugar ABC transporter permease [Chloroflexota bacterium]
MTPALLLLIVFIAYPFVLGVWYSMSDVQIFGLGKFIGLANYQNLLNSPVFIQTVKNSFIYTGFATVFKLALGLGLALVMNQAFPFKNLIRASVLLPYIVPTALSTLAFLLAFNPTLSPLPWIFGPLHIPYPDAGFLGQPGTAMGAVIFVNTWRGTPFFAISLLAGLQTIPQDLYEAASIDGANAINRFRHVTVPLLMPVLTIVMLFSIIQTFADFQIVQVLTRGGPADSTHLFATLAFQIGMQGGRLGQGAAVSLFMLPFLGLLVIAQLWYTRRGAAA